MGVRFRLGARTNSARSFSLLSHLGSGVRGLFAPFGRPARAQIWDAVGRALVRRGRASWALFFYRRATILDSLNSKLWYHRGAAAMRAARLEEAASCYRVLLRLKRDHPRSFLRLAGIYDLIGAPQAGLEVCRRGIEQWPLSACFYRLMGRLLLRTGAVTEALRALQKALELAPRHNDTRYYLGLMLSYAGRAAEAREALRHALSLRPDDPKLYYALGLCCRNGKQDPEQVQYLLEGLSAEQLAAGLAPPCWVRRAT